MTCDNINDCSCTSVNCPRHGKCCECVVHHRKKGEVPGCFFSHAGEKTYDRSIAFLYKDYQENK